MDDDWVLHKRIINFAVIGNHMGDSIGKLVEVFLMNWGIDKIFTITVDNALSNDVAVEFMKKRLTAWRTLQLGGDYLHLRCCCHIINLIVQDGIKELNAFIQGIRNAVRYIRHSSQRLDRFREMDVLEKLDPQANVGLDVVTRWNSTYLMLVAAKKYQRGFERLGEEDVGYVNTFKDPKTGDQKLIGPPDSADWENAEAGIDYLKVFHEATLHLNASKSITSNQVLHEFTGIHMHLVARINNEEDAVLYEVEKVMKLKFDKYWGKFEKVNQLMLVANVHDPRWKLDYIPHCYIDVGTKQEDIERISSQVNELLVKLYKEYKEFYPQVGNAYMEADSVAPMDIDGFANQPIVDVRVERLNKFVALRKAKKVVEICNEVDKYLMEAPENPKNKGFELSAWWKENTPRYPILSKVAKDVFDIPVSTVASESAFSLGK
uniref:zinc finger BED domain-containing protein RICESLEEPER 2-like n=1 Tax=Fragaria vesca subsp. vesca TaxID=101020 RepID=UPI0005C85BEE|nr:PREDICTED: zinc finger BED domain-containing protein RICESLEEPER 2-like [Fragaria vesca subsp. vesca]